MTDNDRKYQYIKAWIRKWEGSGFVNDPDDTPTKWGVTIATFRRAYGKTKTIDDLKNMTESQWDTVFRKYFYDKMHADDIENWSIAKLCVSCCWGSGTATAIKKIQNTIGCKSIDGCVGPETLGKLNAPNTADTFKRLWNMRYVWFHNIVQANPVKGKYLRGWLNKLNDQRYVPTQLQK